MVFVFIAAALLLLVAAFWLWRLRKTRKIDLEVETELVSSQELSAALSPSFYSQYPVVSISPPTPPRASRGGGLLFGAAVLLIGLIVVSITLLTLLHAPGASPIGIPTSSSPTSSFLWILGGAVLGVIVLTGIAFASFRFHRFLKAKQQQGRVLVRGVVGLTASYRRAQYIGRLIFPQQVYEGNSESISVAFQKGHWTPKSSEAPSFLQDLQSQEQVALHIPKEGAADEQLLEAELLAAGLTVAGSGQQRQTLGGSLLSYRWNCYFPNSGKHTFTLILRVVSPSGTMELDTIERSIKVTKFAGLTQRQVGMAAGVAGVAGFVLTIASIFSTLHIFGL